MKNKAFTLIELLAVIIILGVLTTLIAPKVVNMLDEAEKNTNLTSAQNLVKSASLKASNNEMTGMGQNIKINYTTGENISYLDYTGDKPTNGQINIKSNGEVAMAVKFDDYCYLKSYNSNDITVISYNESTCGENADVFTNYTMPELATTGDGLYESTTEPGRYIYRGSNPNNYIYLKENGTNVLYRIISYEPDDTIKVVRDTPIIKDGSDKIVWDGSTDRKNNDNTYCNSSNGCNVWGNQTNTIYNELTLSDLEQDFYYYYYPDREAINFSIKPQNNFGTVTNDSSLNTYLNNTWINTLSFKDKIENHSFNVGGVYYYNPFNNGYSGGDKGIIKEKQEENVYTWNGNIGLLNITEFVETSLSDTCTDVWSNYYYNPNNVTQNPEDSTKYTANYSSGQWPCALKNWNYKNYNQWSLSANSSNRYSVWSVHGSGYFYNDYANNTNFGVRPAFYLKSNIKLGGLGTSDSPYELVEN